MTDCSRAGQVDTGAGAGIAPPGYRLPAATRLGGIRLQVADLSRSLAYYVEVLGLRALSRTETVATLGTTGDDAVLVTLQQRAGAVPVPHHGRLGLYHYAILLPDRAALGRFVAHLAEIGVRAGASDHAVSEALYLRDPDGLGIEVYADRPRSAWSVTDHQIDMETAPLDLASVIAAANGERWTGMPRGAVIGHVHLHVADIETASAFFHERLGLDKMVWSYPGALFLGAGGYHHHLGVNSWATNAPRPTDGDARLLEWEVLVPAASGGAAGAAASLRHGGYRVEQSGDDWLATDPWGTTLRLRNASHAATR